MMMLKMLMMIDEGFPANSRPVTGEYQGEYRPLVVRSSPLARIQIQNMEIWAIFKSTL